MGNNKNRYKCFLFIKVKLTIYGNLNGFVGNIFHHTDSYRIYTIHRSIYPILIPSVSIIFLNIKAIILHNLTQYNNMNFEQYLGLSNAIVNGEIAVAPYDDKDMYNYTKLNVSRMNRWLKTYFPADDTISKIQAIDAYQQWIVITEPWCGDAAHIVPILYKLSELNENIHFEISLRDGDNSLIDQYLTNGSKSIPKLLVRNKDGEDMAVWGPRPAGAQQLFLDIKAQALPFEEAKVLLQKWYNDDKAVSICSEVVALVTK